jgi:hypothetical protein
MTYGSHLPIYAWFNSSDAKFLFSGVGRERGVARHCFPYNGC